MAGSIARDVVWRCPGCGEGSSYLTWVSVDLSERGDLRAALAEPNFWVRRCPGCQELVERQEPLLILHLSPAAPLVFCATVETLRGDDPMASSQELVNEVRANLGRRADEIPGPVLLADFFMAWVVSTRDLEADLLAPATAADELAAAVEIEPAAYQAFLAEVDAVRTESNFRRALGALYASTSIEQYRSAFEDHPVLADDAAARRAEDEVAAAPDDTGRRVRQAQLDLLLAAQAGEFEQGWAEFERYAAAIGDDVVGPTMERLIADHEAAMSIDPGAAVPIAEELLSLAEAGGDSGQIADARSRIASALLFQPQAETAAIDRAIKLLDSNLELLENSDGVNDQALGRVLIDLGAAYGRRRSGDVVANVDRAAELQRRALALKLEDNQRAIALTNVGHALVDRASLVRATLDDFDRARSSRNRLLLEGIDAMEQALALKSRARDPSDWAYTQINLGLAYSRLDREALSQDLRRALEHYDEAIAGFSGPRDAGPLAYALRNRADTNTRLIALSQAQAEVKALAAAVERDIEKAMSTAGWEPNSFEEGRALLILAQSQLAARGYQPGAVQTFRRALQGLASDGLPRALRQAASQLADLATEAGDWEVAAESSEIAAEAGALAADARAGRTGRFDEIYANENLFRWTAYRLVRAARPERAVEILELGRARELGAWLQRDLDALEQVRYLNPELARRFAECQSALAELDRSAGSPGPKAVDGAAVADELAAMKQQIRALPGLENFLVHPGFLELAPACSDGAAVVYPLTSPGGSCLVVLSGDPITARVIECRDISSAEIVKRLVEINAAGTDVIGGFLPALATPGPTLDYEFDRLAELLGPNLLAPLASVLSESGVESLCLIPIGLLGYVPLHALGWPTAEGETCLLEQFDVSFAPSARARGACIERAQVIDPNGRNLVVGDPQPHPEPLPYAPTEIRAVFDALGPRDCEALTGTEATRTNVLGALAGATRVHFACHGHSMIDPERLDAGLSLANAEELTAADFLEVADFAPRLVVASACQTGMISGYEIADEALSLSTVMIGAGAAGVIASLWSVNDFATTVLMAKVYEGLSRGLALTRALRVAQLWIRKLSLDQALEYVEAHPRLGADLRSPIQAVGEPFDLSAPTFWAGFTLNGA